MYYPNDCVAKQIEHREDLATPGRGRINAQDSQRKLSVTESQTTPDARSHQRPLQAALQLLGGDPIVDHGVPQSQLHRTDHVPAVLEK